MFQIHPSVILIEFHFPLLATHVEVVQVPEELSRRLIFKVNKNIYYEQFCKCF